MGNSNSGSLIDYDPRKAANDSVLELDPMRYPNLCNSMLGELPLDQLISLPQEEQMRFSDAITRRYALNPKFLRLQRQHSKRIDWSQRQFLNETSIGNVAFIAHWNPDDAFWQEQYALVIQSVQK